MKNSKSPASADQRRVQLAARLGVGVLCAVTLLAAAAVARPVSKRNAPRHRLMFPGEVKARLDQGRLKPGKNAAVAAGRLAANNISVRFNCASDERVDQVRVTSLEQASGWRTVTAAGSTVEQGFGRLKLASKAQIQSLCPRNKKATIRYDVTVEADAMCVKGSSSRLAKSRLKVKTVIDCDIRVARWFGHREARGHEADSSYIGGARVVNGVASPRPLCRALSGGGLGWREKVGQSYKCRLHTGGSTADSKVLSKHSRLMWQNYRGSTYGALDVSLQGSPSAYACRATVAAPKKGGRPQNHRLTGRYHAASKECRFLDVSNKKRSSKTYQLLIKK